MGNYINKLPDGTGLGLKKSDQLSGLPGVEELKYMPPKLSDVPAGKVLVAVVNNGPFESALVCDNEVDFKIVEEAVIRSLDSRPVRHFLIDRDLVRKMADEPLYSERKKK